MAKFLLFFVLRNFQEHCLKIGRETKFHLSEHLLVLRKFQEIHGLLITVIFMFPEISRSNKIYLGDFVLATSSMFLNANKNDIIDQLAPFNASVC